MDIGLFFHDPAGFFFPASRSVFFLEDVGADAVPVPTVLQCPVDLAHSGPK
jgi:hypothetical protein